MGLDLCNVQQPVMGFFDLCVIRQPVMGMCNSLLGTVDLCNVQRPEMGGILTCSEGDDSSTCYSAPCLLCTVIWLAVWPSFVHGRCHFVAAVHPFVQELTFPPEFETSSFVDPELKQLAQALPTILVQDRAATTISTYLRAYKSWKAWATQRNSSFLPADQVTFTLYVVSLIQQARSVSTVNSAVYGVSYVHKKSGYQEPGEYPLVKQLTEAAKRILARPPLRKKPLTIDQVQALVTRLERGTVADLQLAALLSLGFFGFLLWDDLHHLSVDSLHFGKSHVAIFLRR